MNLSSIANFDAFVADFFSFERTNSEAAAKAAGKAAKARKDITIQQRKELNDAKY